MLPRHAVVGLRRCGRGLVARRAMSGGSGAASGHPRMVDLSRFASDSDTMSSRLPQEALDRDVELRRAHVAARASYPANAQPDVGPPVDARLAHRKRLVYRSKQRGWLEVDLLLGSFAVDHAMEFSDAEAREYEAILNLETLDIYNFVSGQQALPKVLDTPMMARLQEYARTNPAGVASPSKYAEIKKKMSN